MVSEFHSDIQNTGSLHLDAAELRKRGGALQVKDVSHFSDKVMKGLDKLGFTLKANSIIFV